MTRTALFHPGLTASATLPQAAAVPIRLAAAAVLLCLVSGCGAGFNSLASAAASASNNATAAPNGPQLGYAWNADDSTLRPLLGIFGSAQVGTSVVPAATYAAGAASVTSSTAVLVGHDGQVYRMTLPSGTPVPAGVTTPLTSSIRLSPSGTAAVLYTAGSPTVIVLTKLAGTPVARTVSLSAAVVDAAPSDTGAVAALIGSAAKSSLSVVPAAGVAATLASLGGAGAVSFSGTGDDLLLADGAANTLTLIRAATTTPTQASLPTAGLLRTPTAVNATLDSHWAVVANGAESSVVRIDLAGATAPLSIACPTRPRMVERMSGNGVFRFSSIGAAPAWSADMASPSPTMRFVPALPAKL